MINQVYRLVTPRQFEINYKEASITSQLVAVRPTYLSICAADQRYYTGRRNKQVLNKKLPMALIHEGVGQVAFDPTGKFAVGTNVVMIPNEPTEKNDFIEENYLPSSHFHSSGYDGFMQDYVFLKPDRIVPLFSGVRLPMAAFIELMSVSMHAIRRFKENSPRSVRSIGVWGDGNLGFITSLFLKFTFPDAKIYVFSKHDYKAEHFSFADEIYYIDNLPDGILVDHAFECVGGRGSENAIGQIIDHIEPMGTIVTLGVSEEPIAVNTRMILEKGIQLLGCSRSGRIDFVNTVTFLEKHPTVCEYLEMLVGQVETVRSISDMISVFEQDLAASWGKTVIKWEI